MNHYTQGVNQPQARRLEWEACHNARDVGGYETRDGRRTRWRRVLRADNLRRLTPSGAAALVQDGVRTILDLRSPFELRLDPCPFAPPCPLPDAPSYRSVPVLDQGDRALAAALEAARSVAELYALMLERCRPRIAAVVAAVGAAPAGGVLVYCHAGKDRTGLITALVLALADVQPATIAADYALSEAYLQPLYDAQLGATRTAADRERLARQLRSPLNAARPETMLDTLAYLDARHRGVYAYLRSAGVAEQDLHRVRSRLRE
jgi:protein-tyrosine phosphatase